MEIFIVITSLVIITGLALAIYILIIRKEAGNTTELARILERLSILNEQNTELRRALDEKLSETHRATQEQLGKSMQVSQAIAGESRKIVAEVTERLTKLDETNKQVINFSAQLQNLQDILKNPKQRGVLGEYFLEETLKNVLPPNSYQMQYELGFDEKTRQKLIVDAVVFVKEKIIPIDSKFSLENYEKILGCADAAEREKLERIFKQDLKNRIDETSKYIKPERNTMDFAFMFIPSEAIYYDLLINKVGAVQISTRDLIEYAFRDRKVVIVSPTSFLAYLQTVLQGLRAMQIEESAKQIRSNVELLGRHIQAYEAYVGKLGTSLATTVGHYNNAYKELGKIEKDVFKIAGGELRIEPALIEKPKTE